MHRSRPFSLLLGFTTLVLSGCKQEFKPFESFPKARVRLPDPVQATVQAIPCSPRPNEETPPPITVYFHEDRNGTYLVSAYSIQAATGDGSHTDEDRLLEASKAIKKHFRLPPEQTWSPVLMSLGRILYLEISYTLSEPKQYARTRLYLVDGTLYNLTAVGTEKWVKDSKEFLTSFELKMVSEGGAK